MSQVCRDSHLFVEETMFCALSKQSLSHVIIYSNNKICEYYEFVWLLRRSQWPRGLRSRSAAARLLRLWVLIPAGAGLFICCECCVLSGRGHCDGLITRPEESYRVWCVVVCDLETSWMRSPWPTGRGGAIAPKTKSGNIVHQGVHVFVDQNTACYKTYYVKDLWHEKKRRRTNYLSLCDTILRRS